MILHQSPQEQGGRPGVHPHAAAALLSPSTPLTTGVLRTWLRATGRTGPVVTADVEALVAILVAFDLDEGEGRAAA